MGETDKNRRAVQGGLRLLGLCAAGFAVYLALDSSDTGRAWFLLATAAVTVWATR